jgi:hypothetical protein
VTTGVYITAKGQTAGIIPTPYSSIGNAVRNINLYIGGTIVLLAQMPFNIGKLSVNK